MEFSLLGKEGVVECQIRTCLLYPFPKEEEDHICCQNIFLLSLSSFRPKYSLKRFEIF